MRAELRDSLEHLCPDSEVGTEPCRSMTIDVARGGTVAVHVLLNDLKEGAIVRMAVRTRKGFFGAARHSVGHRRSRTQAARWFRLIDVPVEANTGPVSFIEKEGERNRFVTRRAPFRVYDAMEPVKSSVRASSSTMALRLHMPVPRDVRPLERDCTLAIRSGTEVRELRLSARVHKPIIPPLGRESFPYTNWFSLEHMAARHRLKPWARRTGRWSAATPTSWCAHGRTPSCAVSA